MVKIVGKIRKSNSSYGNYSVTIEERKVDYGGYARNQASTKFFFRKKDADKFVEQHS